MRPQRGRRRIQDNRSRHRTVVLTVDEHRAQLVCPQQGYPCPGTPVSKRALAQLREQTYHRAQSALSRSTRSRPHTLQVLREEIYSASRVRTSRSRAAIRRRTSSASIISADPSATARARRVSSAARSASASISSGSSSRLSSKSFAACARSSTGSFSSSRRCSSARAMAHASTRSGIAIVSMSPRPARGCERSHCGTCQLNRLGERPRPRRRARAAWRAGEGRGASRCSPALFQCQESAARTRGGPRCERHLDVAR